MVGAPGHRALPEVPVEFLGDFRSLGEFGGAVLLSVDVLEGVASAVDFRDIADCSGTHHFHESADAAGRMALIADLRHEVLLARNLPQGAEFRDAVRQWLLAVDVLPKPHRRHGSREVRVVRRRHEHGINAIRHLIEHLPEITEALCLRMLSEAVRRPSVIDVAQGDHILMRHAAQVGSALTTAANHRQPDPVVGRLLLPLSAQHSRSHNLKSKGSSGRKESSAFHHDP